MGRPQRLRHYIGPLDPEDAATGIQAARLNALSLLEAAEELLASKKYALATMLSILAIEEATKVPIIFSILLSSDSRETKKLWKKYRTHTAKGSIYPHALSWVVYTHHPRGKDKKLQELVADTTPEPETMEFVKQLMLYSDCFTDKAWTLPVDQASRDKAKFMLDDARAIILQLRDYSPEELAVWKRHLYELDSISTQEKKNAFSALHKELLEKKFIKPDWWKDIFHAFGGRENRSNE